MHAKTGSSRTTSFDPQLERTVNRLRKEQREAQVRNQAIMQNQEE